MRVEGLKSGVSCVISLGGESQSRRRRNSGRESAAGLPGSSSLYVSMPRKSGWRVDGSGLRVEGAGVRVQGSGQRAEFSGGVAAAGRLCGHLQHAGAEGVER